MFGAVFAFAAILVFVLSLFDIRIFTAASTSVLFWDVIFLLSALVLSSVIITVSIYLSRR